MSYQPTYRFAAFDMDGTLLDSMKIWRGLIPEYLIQKGYPELAEKLREPLYTLLYSEGIQYARPYLEQLNLWPIRIENRIQMLADAYKSAQPKPRVPEFLELLRQKGVRMCVLTSTEHELTELALKQTGLRDYFEFILTPDEFPACKTDRAIFDETLRRFGAKAGETALFEDALYSLKTAKPLGFHLVGIEDPCAAPYKGEIQALADEYFQVYP